MLLLLSSVKMNSVSNARTLPRPPRVLKTVSSDRLGISEKSPVQPTSAPIVSGSLDGGNRFNFPGTLGRSETKVMMRRHGSNSSIRRKTSVSLFFAKGVDVRNSGDHWQELLVDAEMPGEILCRCLDDSFLYCWVCSLMYFIVFISLTMFIIF